MIATFFDTETTGLIINPARKLENQPEIISIAICDANLQTGEVSNKWYKIFKPIKLISQEITDITGFTNTELSDKEFIGEYLPWIGTRLESAQLIIGQNITFDKSMIELELKRRNLTIKWPKCIDLVENSIYLKGYRLKLKELHQELFGKMFDDAHQADIDVDATVRCAVEMYKRGLL